MRGLRHWLAGLLASALIAWALAGVLGATVYNSDYMTAAAETSGLYRSIAAALPDALVKVSGGTVDRSTFASLITPSLVQERLEYVIGGTARAWELGKQAPHLDLSDVGAQIQAFNLPLPAGLAALLDASQALTSPDVDRVAGSIGAATRFAGGVAPLAAGVLALIIVLTGGRLRWKSLAGAGLSAALVCGIIAVLVWALPAPATAALSTSAWSDLAEPVRAYLVVVAHGVTLRLLAWAVCLAVAALSLLVLPPVLRRHRASARQSAEAEPVRRRDLDQS